MSEAGKSAQEYQQALVNREHAPWLQPIPPNYYSSFHPYNTPGRMEQSQYQSRMMPLDLSYHQQHQVGGSHSIYSPDAYYNPPVSSPSRPTYFDMDTGQQSYMSPEISFSRPTPASQTVQVTRPPPASQSLPGSRPSPASRSLSVSKPHHASRALPLSKSSHASRALSVLKPSHTSRALPLSKPSHASRALPLSKPSHASRALSLSKPPPASRPLPVTLPPAQTHRPPVSQYQFSNQVLPVSELPPTHHRAAPSQLSLEMPRVNPIAAHQSIKPLPAELISPQGIPTAAQFNCADSTGEDSVCLSSSDSEHSSDTIANSPLDKPIALTSPSRSKSSVKIVPLDKKSAFPDESHKKAPDLVSDCDMDVEVIERPSAVDTHSEKVKTLASKEFSHSESASSHSRSRRPVERYQVIHDYRGRKNNIADGFSKRQFGAKQRTKPAKQKMHDNNVDDTLSTARKLTNDLLWGKCKVSKSIEAEEQLTKSVMVPDSTTEPLSTSSSSTDLELMMAEQLAKSIPGVAQKESKPRPLDISPCKVLLNKSPSAKSVSGLTPSQTSPTLFKALTSKASSIDSDLQVIKQAEKVKLSSPKSPVVEVAKSTDSISETTTSSQPEASQEDKPVEAEFTVSSIGRRRRVCQTDFYQIKYPEPKRRKSADSQRQASKPKLTKQGESTTPPQPKGWRGKSNLLPSAIESTDESVELSPSKPEEQQQLMEADSQASDTTKKAPPPKEKDDGELMEGGRTVGRIVWARLTARCKAWPAMTIRGSTAAQSPASTDNQWVFWYGEHKVSEVQICRLQDFDIEFNANFKPGSGALYTSAVMEALKDCWAKLNAPTGGDEPKEVIPEGLEKLIAWSESNFIAEKSILPTGELSKAVGERLADIVEMINNADESSDESDDEVDKDYEVKRKSSSSKSKKVEEVTVRKPNPATRVKAVSRVNAGELELETICLSCGDQGGPNLQAHPLFNGGVCEECLEHVKDSFFSFGSDGCMSYCVICGNGGELLVCDSQTCGRTYCNQCIEVLGSEQLLNEVIESDPWNCFLCKPMNSKGILIQNREDWKQRLMRFYQKPSKLHNLPECKPDRKLRVMSLFDGIGTAKVVLDNLNLDVEVYYSLEIEEDAIQVINLNHGDNVIHLGDIRSLTEEKLASLGRIDLLVGGSPCNDLALVNPARKGLYDATGTGILFFDFYRILMTLMSRQTNHSVLWLFENVVHMNKETKETISRFLECEPVKLDAGVFSAQSRSRYFWGNIPGMFCPVSPEMMSVNIRLQDVLSKGREAAVSKIRTVTTRGASLLQGKNEDMHAVVMNGQSDKLWPTELERVFGLPVHYTDAGNLAPGKRQKLLGRSWCVPVIEHLLKPLTHLFAVKQADTSKQPCCCGAKK